MSDYYGYTPTVTLCRPVAIAGSPESRFREVAYDLAALSGLSLKDLCGWIEHVAGRSVRELNATEEGVERHRKLETEMLPRLLKEKPYGIAALSEKTLDLDLNVDVVRRCATLVYLNRSELILHSIPLQEAEVIVDMERNSVHATVRILNDALPRLSLLGCGDRPD